MTVSKQSEIQIHERLTRIETQIESIDGKINNLIDNQINTPTKSECQNSHNFYNKMHIVSFLLILSLFISLLSGNIHIPFLSRNTGIPVQTEIEK